MHISIHPFKAAFVKASNLLPFVWQLSTVENRNTRGFGGFATYCPRPELSSYSGVTNKCKGTLIDIMNKTEHAVQSYTTGKTNKIAMLTKQC